MFGDKILTLACPRLYAIYSRSKTIIYFSQAHMLAFFWIYSRNTSV
jgi:hypothetical protein